MPLYQRPSEQCGNATGGRQVLEHLPALTAAVHATCRVKWHVAALARQRAEEDDAGLHITANAATQRHSLHLAAGQLTPTRIDISGPRKKALAKTPKPPGALPRRVFGKPCLMNAKTPNIQTVTDTTCDMGHESLWVKTGRANLRVRTHLPPTNLPTTQLA